MLAVVESEYRPWAVNGLTVVLPAGRFKPAVGALIVIAVRVAAVTVKVVVPGATPT